MVLLKITDTLLSWISLPVYEQGVFVLRTSGCVYCLALGTALRQNPRRTAAARVIGTSKYTVFKVD